MIKFIKEWKKQREEKAAKILNYKVLELRHYITKYFEDLQKTNGSVELPAWIECKKVMNEKHIDIKHPKTVNFYYRKLQKYKLANNL